MEDGSRRSQNLTLKDQWHLFWEGLSFESSEDESEIQKNTHKKDSNLSFLNELKSSDVPALTPEFFEEISKQLSSERQKAHQQLEKINKEIDLLNLKIESLKIVGGDSTESLQRLNELTEAGFQFSTRLEKMDMKLKEIRHQQQEALSDDWL